MPSKRGIKGWILEVPKWHPYWANEPIKRRDIQDTHGWDPLYWFYSSCNFNDDNGDYPNWLVSEPLSILKMCIGTMLRGSRMTRVNVPPRRPSERASSGGIDRAPRDAPRGEAPRGIPRCEVASRGHQSRSSPEGWLSRISRCRWTE